MIAFCQDCGVCFPVVADACQFPDKLSKMPAAEGAVEGTSVKVLRDTGCSAIVVQRALVPDDKLTGRVERCILIDGTVRYTPGAKIYVQTPLFSGLTTAICMENPIYDLVIGNVPGARDVSISPPVSRPLRQFKPRVKKRPPGI